MHSYPCELILPNPIQKGILDLYADGTEAVINGPIRYRKEQVPSPMAGPPMSGCSGPRRRIPWHLPTYPVPQRSLASTATDLGDDGV
jgi:hypothetical protein